jgi:hypothetical protein
MTRAGAAMIFVALIAVGCVSSPTPTAPVQSPTPSPSPALSTGTPIATTTIAPTSTPAAPPSALVFDVENRSSTGVWLNIGSDVAGDCLIVDPGEHGSIAIRVEKVLGVEVYRSGGPLLQFVKYPDPMPFTLVIEDGSSPGKVKLSTRSGSSSSTPALTDHCQGG